MAWMEGKLQPIDLLGALQMKYQRRGMDNSSQGGGSGMMDQAGIQQLMQWGLPATPENLRKLQSGFLQPGQDTMTVKTGSGPMSGEPGFTEKRALSDVPGYISGTPGAQVFAEKMATGRAMLDAMSRGGSTAPAPGAPQDPTQDQINDYQPQQAKPQSVDIANMLGQLYRPQGQGSPSPLASELLSDEQQNKEGLQSLVNKSGGKIPQSMMTGATPLTDMLNTNYTPTVKSPEVIKQKEQESKTRVVGRKEEAEDIEKYSSQLYKSKEWVDIPKETQGEILRVLPGFIMAAKNKGFAPDIQSLIDSFKQQ